MRSRIPIIVSLAITFGLIIGCGVALQLPTAADANRENVSLDTLLQGRQLYINNCSSCHTLYLPGHLTRNEWRKQMVPMQKKAKISDKQKNLILTYLFSGSKD
jgi:Cytochrome c, mono- and diheme variants